MASAKQPRRATDWLVVPRVFELDDIVAAHRLMESGAARGKIVVCGRKTRASAPGRRNTVIAGCRSGRLRRCADLEPGDVTSWTHKRLPAGSRCLDPQIMDLRPADGGTG
jgi:hypothetical protein